MMKLNMDNIKKAQALRMKYIIRQNELTKDLVENMKRAVEGQHSFGSEQWNHQQFKACD
jgi:hypothetical protein